MFHGRRGPGARLDGRPIHASGVAELSEALAAVGFPPNVPPDAPDLLLFLEMLPRCQAIRRTGSSALNLCYLAAGRFDLYWSYSTHIWDVAAGVLILREAGGCVTSPTGGAVLPGRGPIFWPPPTRAFTPSWAKSRRRSRACETAVSWSTLPFMPVLPPPPSQTLPARGFVRQVPRKPVPMRIPDLPPVTGLFKGELPCQVDYPSASPCS